ncbi:hypothetical protein NVV93_00385 [Pseudomonas sp. LS44]|uniref:hypothetical protein n=1 Tax=Pseudomonas sp. LS44 TaxID=1357074 RepID=UPI00215A25A6|nr:hypothetical protein [Pseudomonas sp. LS44]UVE17893.1 hypothetical protein NVV93_00385 [Pseudomonas sp. LS44]
MKLFACRCLSLVALSLALSACQQAPQQQPANLPIDELVSAFSQLQQSIDAGQLDSSASQLAALKTRAAGDTRLESLQRSLAEAYLLQGQRALQQGDLHTASQALAQARSMMPQAPALTTGLDSAISQARSAEQSAAQARATAAASQAQAEAAAKEAAARAEQAKQLRQAAALQASQVASAAPVSAPAAPQARLIDPAAASSVVALPMLDSQDNEQLRGLLDSVAADVVNFRCAVRIEVRQAKDFPWVAALLSARIKRLDPGFVPSLSQALKADQAPRLVLSPQG